ncbi:hypothetical protein [Rhizobium phage RHph_X2_26]|nr:hypothetical protein [Rhizobium phage RHph_X2_26]
MARHKSAKRYKVIRAIGIQEEPYVGKVYELDEAKQATNPRAPLNGVYLKTGGAVTFFYPGQVVEEAAPVKERYFRANDDANYFPGAFARLIEELPGGVLKLEALKDGARFTLAAGECEEYEKRPLEGEDGDPAAFAWYPVKGFAERVRRGIARGFLHSGGHVKSNVIPGGGVLRLPDITLAPPDAHALGVGYDPRPTPPGLNVTVAKRAAGLHLQPGESIVGAMGLAKVVTNYGRVFKLVDNGTDNEKKAWKEITA